MESLEIAINEVGGVGKLAGAIGVGQSVVSNWRARKSVPPEHCAAVEAACRGKVTRRELRPTDWRRIWPELASNEDQNLAPALANSAQGAMESVAAAAGQGV